MSTLVSANSFGKITRYQWNDWPVIPGPLDRVGTLVHPDGNRCTASYIGENYLLTAAHCVMQKGKNKLQKGKYLFEHIQLPNGKYWDSRTITRFHFIELKQLSNVQTTKNHWVIVEMNKDLSKPKRYFGYSYPGDNLYSEYHDSNFNLSIVGFSPNFNGKTRQLSFTDGDCEIKELLADGKVALHDCDCGPRDSGSPLYSCRTGGYGKWKECYISAIHVGAYSENGEKFDHYSRDNGNIAVTMKSFKDTWYYLRAGGKRPYNLKSVDND